VRFSAEILEFRINREFDPSGSQLQDALEAQFASERMGAARSFFAHLLAVDGVVIWLEAIWPGLLSSEIYFFTLAVFGGILFLTVRVAVAEIVSRRKLKRCLAVRRGLVLETPAELS
jgi:hypothetical protein